MRRLTALSFLESKAQLVAGELFLARFQNERGRAQNVKCALVICICCYAFVSSYRQDMSRARQEKVLLWRRYLLNVKGPAILMGID
jgi:hypothetical protein